ncbi:hypothetical protein P154DRAFT_324943 [Amniculicola lignicola CBS 123094]|uniref:Probable double zinc ribbon domain-containing protein n=1 Tax=Amniculicola lignicola CBS 123094 TaxID=1392246 RepID=A0A6A5W2T6_9PLEO|nr:hypothetical protein P154DRAFT_324943 [Amniculicola lignicola CBS 123094]
MSNIFKFSSPLKKFGKSAMRTPIDTPPVTPEPLAETPLSQSTSHSLPPAGLFTSNTSSASLTSPATPAITFTGPEDSPAPEDGKWICCQCQTTNYIYERSGDNPLGALACVCPHKPCEECKLVGGFESFVPIVDPLPVAVAENGEEDPTYGVVCGKCGLSWKAKSIKVSGLTTEKSSGMATEKSKSTNVSTSFGRLRKSASLMSFRAHRDQRPTTAGGLSEGRTKAMLMRFAGIQCTCGSMSTSETFCFKTVKLIPYPPVAEEEPVQEVSPFMTDPNLQQEGHQQEPVQEGPTFATDPELQQMGHQQPVLKIRHFRHPNPLRSNPVLPEDLL